MAKPLPAEDEHIEIAPFIIFALLLIVPFLNLEFTFYRTTLKLFVFQTGMAVLWCYLLWQWGAGRLRGAEWPAYWLFAPLGLWVGWGLVTAAWSPMPWLAGQWVVQGLTGLAGALGLSLLLRERVLRRQFVMASGAVVFVVAVLMAVFYGDPRARFFGDVDVPGREVGAAFLLVPTLVVAALLYGHPSGESTEDERGYLAVLWKALCLLVLLVAGLRAGSAGWLYGLGLAVAVAAWLLARRWRVLAGVLAVLVVVLVAGREARLRAGAEDPPWHAATRPARLDRADWSLVAGRALGAKLVGQGTGTFPFALDLGRPRETYAVFYGDKFEGHARRALTEGLYERGLVGLALALASGLGCVVAGVLAFRRARDRADAALGVGLAAGVVAMGVCACLAPGTVSFGAGMAFWVAVGLLGALSARTARPSALSWSDEEALGRREATSRARAMRPVAGLVGGAGVVVLWVLAAARPFWADYSLRDGRAESEVAWDLGRQQASAKALLAGLRRSEGQSVEEFGQLKARAEDNLRHATAEHRASVRRANRILLRSAAWTLDGRVWLNAQLSLANGEQHRGDPQAAADRYGRIEELCGPILDLDLLRAACCEQLNRPAEAHTFYRRYARKNPLAAPVSLFHTYTNLYEPWVLLIERERREPEADPRWREWGRDFADACAAGLAVYPDHYGLLLHRGEMLYRLGRDEESFELLMAAAHVIRYHLAARPYHKRVQATLLLELVNAYAHWNKQMATTVLGQIGTLIRDDPDPIYRPIKERVGELLMDIDPEGARQAIEAAQRARAAAMQSPLPLRRPRSGEVARPASSTPRGTTPATRAPATRAQP